MHNNEKKRTMKTKETYRIVEETNGWIARRDIRLNGKCKIVLAEGLDLREAQKKLLDKFNEEYETAFINWGLACGYLRHRIESAFTKSDGTRCFSLDSRYFKIELEDSEK